MFALIWSNLLQEDIDRMEEVKQNLVNAYNNSEELFAEGMKCETLNQLLAYVTNHKDDFLTICKIESK
jgi:hypothetical protein